MFESTSLTVTGMKCGGCENTVIVRLTALDGIESVKASFKDQQVDVIYDPAKIKLDEIEDAIAEAGFTVE